MYSRKIAMSALSFMLLSFCWRTHTACIFFPSIYIITSYYIFYIFILYHFLLCLCRYSFFVTFSTLFLSGFVFHIYIIFVSIIYILYLIHWIQLHCFFFVFFALLRPLYCFHFVPSFTSFPLFSSCFAWFPRDHPFYMLLSHLIQVEITLEGTEGTTICVRNT